MATKLKILVTVKIGLAHLGLIWWVEHIWSMGFEHVLKACEHWAIRGGNNMKGVVREKSKRLISCKVIQCMAVPD